MNLALRSVALALSIACGTARGDVFTEGDSLMLQFGPYVYHLHYDPKHNDHPSLFGLEWESRSRLELGAVWFLNSFYQPSEYAYVGKRWFLYNPKDNDGLYVKLTAGPLYGYKGQYADNIPFNHNGLGVVAIPGIGYQYERASAQFVLLGTNGFLVTFGLQIGK